MTDLINIPDPKATDLYKTTAKMIMDVIRKEMGSDYDIIEKYDNDIITDNYGLSFMKVEYGRDEECWEDFCDDPFVAILFDALNIIRYGKLLKCDSYDLSYYEVGREEL